MAWCSLVPGPFKRRRRKGLIHIECACAGGPQKNVGYTHHLSSMELYVMQNPRMITMVTRSVPMETPAHVRAVCTRPFLLLLLKGLGTRLGLVLQVVQWYYSSGVPSLNLLVFYHCIHNSQSISTPSPYSNFKTVVDLDKLLISEPYGMFH